MYKRRVFSTIKLLLHDPNVDEAAYERLIDKDVPFHALDISGLKWTEIDTMEDFRTAEALLINSVENTNE